MKKRDYDLIFERGRRVKTEYFDLIVFSDEDTERKLGVIVSRKIGKAVTRNRVKRRIREILRQERGIFDNGVMVAVLAKPGITELGYRELRDLIVLKLEEALANGIL